MDTNRVFVVNRFGETPHYERRVKIARGYSGNAKTVRVVAESGSGVTNVLVVDSDPDEYITVENPGDLPFLVKVEQYGLPPCPKCRERLDGHIWQSSYGCGRCGVTWKVWELDFKYSGQIWR